MGICCPVNSKVKSPKGIAQNTTNQFNVTNIQEKSIIHEHLSPKGNNNNNILLVKNNSIAENNNNPFPKDTKYEKELSSNFKYFDIFWYDPYNTSDIDNYKICFQRVRFLKERNLEKAKTIFMDESLAKWIVITSGSKGEELLQNFKDFECIKAFIIFSRDIQFHINWAKKYEKVICLTSSPEILCQKLIEFNYNFAFPNLSYHIKKKISSNVNEIQFKRLFDDYALQIKGLIADKKDENKKYYKFCFKSLAYLNSEDFEDDFDDNIGENNNSPLYVISNNLKKLKGLNNNNYFESIISIIKGITLLSLWFESQYPYLFHLLSFQEVKNLFEKKYLWNIYWFIFNQK